MPEPLVCEDGDLSRLMETVHSTPGARILYQDTVRRGGVLGFFAREIHRVAYDVPAAPTTAGDPAAGDPAVAVELGAASVIEPESVAAMASFEALLKAFDETARPDGAAALPSITSTSTTSITAVVPTEAGSLEAGSFEAGSLEAAPVELEPFADLLASAEAAELAVNFEADESAPDFAELLRRLSAFDPESPDQETVSAPAQPASLPVPAGDPLPMAARTQARDRLDMLLQLRQLGVPVSVNPHGDTHDLYRALDDILADLPEPVQPPRQAGAVIAIAGESGAALTAARILAATLRLPRQAIRVAGLAEDWLADLGYSTVSGPGEASRLRQELSQADTPSIVVVATDAASSDPADPWARDVLAALNPTAAWAVVDARWKTEDARRFLARLGSAQALVVHSAELSLSPASVWDLDLPLALLDGRAPTASAWTGLLCRLLANDTRPSHV